MPTITRAHATCKKENAQLTDENKRLLSRFKEASSQIETLKNENSDGREAWELEHELRKQASERIAAIEKEKAETPHEIHIAVDNLDMTQGVLTGDSFSFNSNGTPGGYSVSFTPR